MVVNGVGYLGKACLRAEAVRFGAFGNLTLAAATIIVHLLLILSLVRVLTETLKCYMTRSARLLTTIFGE